MSSPLDTILRRTPPGAALGEGLLWSRRDACVYWVDILGNKLHAYYLADGSSKTWYFPEHIGWVIERQQGGFIAGLMSGFYELRLDPFILKHIANPFPHEPGNRLNDAKADDQGRIWAGSMHKPQTQKSGALYRLDTDLTHREIDGPYQVANGPTFSPDHSKIYHTDSGENDVFVFDIEGGEAVNKRLFVHFPDEWGSPDGMTTDAQGGIWIAHWGGGKVSRFRPDASLDFSVELPAKQITNICFAGDKLDRVFVTSAAVDQPADREAGTLFEIPSELLRGHTGLEPQKFGG
ncbi:SMP-30/gluconolactonase/LRE family protein [Asticcacaulis sp. BYS171W]|uniref:SMP-30/gluconolactonase/LRE family protein n=1 Tax=Asticcacaulis aquaticus TaxID=2984212 RepID=A0ABT5HQA3_9CAUL|nr:SMP-30/gluconolactonase/LRE family protein [Asticcacaulis aquaticus]MDC7682249.1 SMP-30/gluconolactonase/LRE family protein [Asticcacaulis aquaticus]